MIIFLMCRDSTIIWFEGSPFSSCTPSSTSRCSRSSTVISSLRTSSSKSQTSQVSKSLTLAAQHSSMSVFTPISNLGSTGRQRSCLVSHMTVLLTCGLLVASWLSYILDIPSSQVTLRMTKCHVSWRWLESQSAKLQVSISLSCCCQDRTWERLL